MVSCGPQSVFSGNDGGDAIDDGSGSSASQGPSGQSADTSASNGDFPRETDSASTTESADDDTCGGGFASCNDNSDDGATASCSLFVQDCPEGEKCTAWANDGGSSWNDTRCVPVADEPAAPGEACTAEGSGVSGLDNCELGAMCFVVDRDLNGECFAFCTGSITDASCDPGHICAIGSGPLTVCIPQCDPFGSDCEDDEGCYPSSDGFTCAPMVDPEAGHGTPCEFINSCASGYACVGASAFSECSGTGCCSTYCDLSDPRSDAMCEALDPLQSCVAWYAQGEAPPEYETIGTCAIPE